MARTHAHSRPGRHPALRLALVAIIAGLPLAMTQSSLAQILPAIKRKDKEPSKPPQRSGDRNLSPMNVAPPTEPIADKVIQKIRTRSWLMKVEVRVNAFNEVDASTGMPANNTLKFQTAKVVFPKVFSTAGSRFLDELPDRFASRLRLDGATKDDEMKLLNTVYPSGARLMGWEATNYQGNGMTLTVEMPIDTWGVQFDEQLAYSIPWPASWPAEASSTFQPQLGVDHACTNPLPLDEQVKQTNDRINLLIAEWTQGNDPKSIPPVQLAKFLAGQTLQMLQESGDGLAFNRIRPTRTGAGVATFQGFDLKGALKTIEDGRGSEHDIACTLAAIYRKAGLPARVVIGYDPGFADVNKARRSGKKALRSWVEFALVDPVPNRLFWVPVDIVRQRNQSSRAPDFSSKWDFFGNNHELEVILPLSFHYHPPTTVVAHGSPCLWGWLTTPATQMADQTVRFDAITLPARSGDRDARDQAERERTNPSRQPGTQPPP